jgi:hypothetical protein
MLSIGGALGGVFVGLVAPAMFRAFYEFPIGLGLCALLAVVVLWKGQPRSSRGVLVAGLLAYTFWLGVIMHQFTSGYRVMQRNFYGQIRVRESDANDDFGPRRTLLHGRIAHGEQTLDEAYSRLPSTYFCSGTGVGRALSNATAPRRVGILGLGSGTLAVYGRQGDTFRIYEINPQVVEVARKEFTYLRDTAAKVETVLGDGRLMLEREPDQRFDVLVMDAFSGDSVPVHLITLEAFATYLRHMKPDGIVAVNISNKFLDLRPVMERAASRFGKVALAFDFISDGFDELCYDASWVLIMDETVYRAKAKQFAGGEALAPVPGFRPWTDGFSNMFHILK